MDTIEQLEQAAVDSAIKKDWERAITFNKTIIKTDAKNAPALLRLGFCYLQKAEYDDAKKYYHKALKIHPKHAIATHNLEKIEILKRTKGKSTIEASFDPNLFIEISGKTKSAVLTNLGQKTVLAKMYVGQKVILKIKRRKIEVRTEQDDYIGACPDDLSKRLILFMKAKSEYTAYIKESGVSRVVVFIKEEKKGRAVQHHVSFPLNIQKNLDQISHIEDSPTQQTESEDEEHVDDWDRMVEEIGEEKEELLNINHEELEEEDEE